MSPHIRGARIEMCGFNIGMSIGGASPHIRGARIEISLTVIIV